MKTRIRLKKKILKSIGQRLKYFRTKKGISQENLAFKVRIDRTYIGAIEQGLRSPSVYCLFTIANALDTTLSELVNFAIE